MIIDRQHTVSFSGHRSFKAAPGEFASLHSRVRDAIIFSHADGFRTFLSGMAEGFDLIAAREVLNLRDEGLPVKLIAVVPYAGQRESMNGVAVAEYDAVVAEADHVHILSPEYHDRCFHVRNDFLIANSSRLICYYNGSAGGTRYTFRKAQRGGLSVVNLCEAHPVAGMLF